MDVQPTPQHGPNTAADVLKALATHPPEDQIMVRSAWKTPDDLARAIAEIAANGASDPGAIARRLVEHAPAAYETMRAKQGPAAVGPTPVRSPQLQAMAVTQDAQDSQKTRRPSENQETQRFTATEEKRTEQNPKEQKGTIGAEDSESEREVFREKFVRWRTLPFAAFLKEARDFHYERRRSGPAGRYTPLYHFAWVLRGHPEMEIALWRPMRAFAIVDEYLAEWTKEAAATGDSPPFGTDGQDDWMSWFGVSRGDARAEFVDVWDKARFIPGVDVLTQARDAARRKPLQMPRHIWDTRPIDTDALGEDETDYGGFVSIAAHLQVIMGDRPILLPCRELGNLLGLSPMTISRYRKWAIQDGFLRVVKRHRYQPKGVGEATEFRFDLSLFPALADKAQAEAPRKGEDGTKP